MAERIPVLGAWIMVFYGVPPSLAVSIMYSRVNPGRIARPVLTL